MPSIAEGINNKNNPAFYLSDVIRLIRYIDVLYWNEYVKQYNNYWRDHHGTEAYLGTVF